MEFDDIEHILDLIKEHDLAEFELERDGLKLRIRKASPGYTGPPLVHAVHAPAIAPLPAGNPHGSPVSPAAAQGELDDEAVELAVVKSPIVGTFYRAAEPGAPPFVEVGQRIRRDQVLCIIEAMKLMNEITSEYDGEIVSIYVDNGKPVQYGERLFAIKTL